MNILERRVLCTIEKGYSSDREEQIGKLRVYFEIFSNGEIYPVNQNEDFCDTEQVFVTGGYGDLKEKFKSSLFEVNCSPTNFERKDGDCKYVTRASSCEDIKGLLVCQYYNSYLPTPSNPILVIKEKPLTKTILIRDNDFIYGPFDYISDYEESTNQYILTLKAINTPVSKLPQYHICKIGIKKCVPYNFENKTQEILLIANLKKIFEQADEVVDFITDDQIISTYGNKIAQNSDIRSFSKGTIAQIRKHYSFFE